MAEIVAVLATVHTPGLTGWIEEEEPRKRKNILGALAELRKKMMAAKPDVIVGVANDHMLNCPPYNMPDFEIGVAEQHYGPAPGYEQWLRLKPFSVRGHRELARALINEGAECDVGFACLEHTDFDDNFSVPLHYLTPDMDIPFVPVMVNCIVPPQPSPERCYQVGQVIKHIIEDRYPGKERVALVATGGLSHEPGGPKNWAVDEEFDRWFLELLQRGDHAEIVSKCTIEKMDAAGLNGTTELLAWLVVLAATRGPAEVLAYEPTHQWRCGSGQVWWPNLAPR
jgi:aromatic ring-opening dioxygenase catalytic subunit (LigB family)